MITPISDLQNDPRYNALVASDEQFQQFSSTLARSFPKKDLPYPLNNDMVRKIINAAPTQNNANHVVSAVFSVSSSGKLEGRDLSFTRLHLTKFMHITTDCSDGTILQDPGIPLDSSIVRKKEGEIFLGFCAEAGNAIHLQKYSSVWFPTPLLHQSLFFPSKDKPAMLEHEMFSSSWGTIEFTGPRLNIYHEIFLLHLLQQVTQNKSGNRATYVGSKRDFVRDILRAMYPETSYYGGADEERIMGYLEDLSKASFCFVKKDPKTGEITGRSEPIPFLRYECSEGTITIVVDRYFIPTGRKGFTLVNLNHLHAIEGNIAKALYLFLKSHSLNPKRGYFNSNFIKVARALLLVQDGDDPDDNRQRQILRELKQALLALKELGLISEDSGAYANANTVDNETFEDLISSSGMNTTSDLAAPDPRTGTVRNAKELRVKNALSPLAFFLLFTLACFFLATKKTTVFVKISHLYAFFKDNVCFRFFARELNYAMGQLIRRGILLETSSMGTTKPDEFPTTDSVVTLSITKAFAKRCEESFDKNTVLETIVAVLTKQEHLMPDNTQQQKVKVSKKTRKVKETAREMANAARSEAGKQEESQAKHITIVSHTQEAAQCQDVGANSSCQEASPASKEPQGNSAADPLSHVNQVNEAKAREATPLPQSEPANEMANAAKNTEQPMQTQQAVSLDQTGNQASEAKAREANPLPQSEPDREMAHAAKNAGQHMQTQHIASLDSASCNQANKNNPGTSLAGGYVVIDKDTPLLRCCGKQKGYSTTIPQTPQNFSISISCTSKGWKTNPGKSTTRDGILQPQTIPVQGFLDLSVGASLMNQTICSGIDFLRTGGSRVLDQMLLVYKNPFVRFQYAAGT